MALVVLPLLAAMAVLHSLWNVLLKTSEDPLATSARAVAWGLALATPPLGVVWFASGRPLPSASAIGLAGGSAVVELLYFVFLSAAYRRGDLSTVYPIARGTAPVLSVLSGLVLLGERLHPVAATGVVLVLAGIWLVRTPAGSGPAVRYALLTSVTIAAYSTIDRLGVQAAPLWLYAWILWLFTAALLRAAMVARATVRGSGSDARSAHRRSDVGVGSWWEGARRDIIVGAAMLGGWLLVLVALSLAPLAVVAPLREAGIVLTAGWGVFRLRERSRAAFRIGGAVVIAVGVLLVALA